jgi:hypothetical protein
MLKDFQRFDNIEVVVFRLNSLCIGWSLLAAFFAFPLLKLDPSHSSSRPLPASYKSKVKLSRYHDEGAMGERSYSSYSFLTSTIDRVSGQRHAPAALYPRLRTTGTHWTGGWVSLRDVLDTEARGKIICLCPGSNPFRPVCRHKLH